MQSPLKKIIVYDLETGGLSCKFNSITEIAMVAIELETLKKIDEISVMLKPRLDVRGMEGDDIKEAKALYKRLGTKDEASGIKVLMYGNEKITLKNIDPLVEGVSSFRKIVEEEFCGGIIDFNSIKEGLDGEHKDIFQIYVDSSYTPQALEVTKIPFKLLCEEGVSYKEAFFIISSFMKEHTVGNSKPIIAGHNIKNFDNPFLELFFEGNKSDLYKSINGLQIDTLEMARLKFWELPSYSLGVIANEMGMTLKSAHRALPDTIANADVLIKMLKSLKGDGSKGTKYTRRKFNLNY